MGFFDAAQQSSERRSTIYFPSFERRSQLTRSSRRSILKKISYLRENVGAAKRLIDGASTLVGTLTPQIETEDEGWNEEAEQVFARFCGQHNSFDRAGKHDFYSWQRAITQARFAAGDSLTVLIKNKSNLPQIAFYESHQIDSKRRESDSNGLAVHDGVWVNRGGKHVEYSLLELVGGELSERQVRASRCIYHGDVSDRNFVRGPSPLAHAASNLIDMLDILADAKHASKVAAQFGVVLEGRANAGGGTINPSLSNFLAQQEVTGGDGQQASQINVEDMLKGGRLQEVEGSLKTLQDSRPHPNTMTLLDFLIADMAWGIGLPPQVAWDISGLTGPGTRFVMAELSRWIKMQQAALQRPCTRFWSYAIAALIEAGQLSQPPAGSRWYAPKWLPAADLTIDRGREGALQLKQLESGALLQREYWAGKGLDWRDAIKAQVAEEVYIRQLRSDVGLIADE